MDDSQDKKSDLKSELDKLKSQAEEYLNGWKRAKADLVNYQKDEIKRLEEAVKFANQNLMRDLIAPLDGFDLAITALEKQGSVDKGIYMIRLQLTDILKRHGLENIIVAEGQPFDPGFQEAIGEAESDQPAGSVVEIVEKGYVLGGKVLRPARVKIAKKPLATSD